MKCCNYDQNCPEWTVLKEKFIITDDYGNIEIFSLSLIDEILSSSKNSMNLTVDKNDPDKLYSLYGTKIKMTKQQFEALKEQWSEYKSNNKELFKKEE
jgi:hypothetical protein